MTLPFSPDTTHLRAYKAALGRFTTGIAVVTAMTPQGAIGMTINSFVSVSLAPPLILWSCALSAQRYPLFAAAERFAVHVLKADQKPLSEQFSRGPGFTAPPPLDADGVPVIGDVLARFACALEARHRAGDHELIIGHVRTVTMGEGEPLCHFSGQYGAFSA